ncbi:baculoviral IAP repeat-containing protein 1 [Bombina bombina]|uniref:baculoviral IAP repeat-containing protein 1 n=1 Tax=Bombina bombina TaxID=8345 RepID=UPI00235A9D7A|nr:baculoviral IAP repeat-containing protein 1 [Bombina bombina]
MASSAHTEVGEETVNVMDIQEFKLSEMEERLSFLNLSNLSQMISEKNKEFSDIRQQLGNSYNAKMRSESWRLKSFLSFNKLSSWCPKAMASAGFYFTGTDRSVQCFCCGLVFCSTSLRTPPYEDHLKHNPTCGFIQGKDVGNISKYDVRVHSPITEQESYSDEESRLNSFTDWPFYVKVQPSDLAHAGFFFTGRRDDVQCFSCVGCLGNWEENDDPWREHAKWFPECQFLASMKTQDEIKEYITQYMGFYGFTGKHFTPICSSFGVRILCPATGCKHLGIFEEETVRMESFKEWPPNVHAEPASLAKSGFYYTGISDAVKCFTCGVSIRSFEPDDEPNTEHLKFSPRCEFLKKITDMTKEEKPNANQATELPDANQATELPDANQATELPDANQATELLDANQATELPDANQATELPDANQATELPDSNQATELPDSNQATELPDANQATELPDANQATELPDSNQATELPDANQATELPDANQATELPDANQATELPDANQATELPDANQATELPDANQATELPEQLPLEKSKQCSTAANYSLDPNTKYWFQDAAKLRNHLMDVYCDSRFSKVLTFGDSSCVSTELKSLFADISAVLKDSKNKPLQHLTFPDILSDLRDITMIEGETGSGKTALLKKIAILWASGCCPILSRFRLVFYISVSSIERHQTLSDIVCKQLIGQTTPLTEETLGEILKQLKNQVLFLLDDYGVMDSVPEAIENLLLKNHLSKMSLALTVRPDKGRNLRQYARTVLSIQEFPLYSSIYIIRQLFSHDMSLVERFLVELISCKTLQAALKTPLFTFALCVFWVQNPNQSLASDKSICMAYLKHSLLKYIKETELVKSTISSCGDLALIGLLHSKFDFKEEDLCAAAVISTDALKFGLLSKFTSQRLHPIYMFFHPSFQEFLAGKRISELLESSDTNEINKGFSYLQHINTFLKFAGQFYYFLIYACMFSHKTTSVIISHLFSLLDNSEAFDCPTDSKLHLQHHPMLSNIEQILTLLSTNQHGHHLSFVMHLLLMFAINVSHSGGFKPECAPIILQFLKGKDITVSLSSSDMLLIRFLAEYPEALSLIESLTLSITGIRDSGLDFIYKDDFSSYWSVPMVERDYSMAFQHVSNMFKKDEDNYYPRKTVEISNVEFSQGPHKVAVLKVEASGRITEWENILPHLKVFISLSNRVELSIDKSPGFHDCVKNCIEQYQDLFVKCSIKDMEINSEEQELIMQMSSLESLIITKMQPPDHLLSHLDIFKRLKELTLSFSHNTEVLEILPDGFKNIISLEKLIFYNVDLTRQSSRLAEILAVLPNLKSFHLNCDCCPEFEKIVDAISQNGKIQEISLKGLFVANEEIVALASALPSFQNLNILDIQCQHLEDDEAAKVFAHTLPYLVLLEELKLPSGPAMKRAAVSIIQQLRYLLHLKVLSFTNDVLIDISLLELAKEAKAGHLKNIVTLILSTNHDATQTGWTDFFTNLDNIPHLKELDIVRIYAYQFKIDPSTLKALVQCVSKLHSLNKLIMQGWLMDEKDLEMFNAMKQNHPQAKSFMLLWQWILPFNPVLQE